MKALGSIAAVIAAVLEDSDAEAAAIEREAADTIAALPRGPAAAAILDEAAIAEARERARIALAHEDWEDVREAISEREAWLARAIEAGRIQLGASEAPEPRRERLLMLAREAIARLPGGPIEIAVGEADAPLLDAEWRAALLPASPDQILIVTAAIDGGVLARTRDGRASFDNTWPARAERLESTWRAALADLYDHAAAPLAHATGGRS